MRIIKILLRAILNVQKGRSMMHFEWFLNYPTCESMQVWGRASLWSVEAKVKWFGDAKSKVLVIYGRVGWNAD